MLPRARSSTSLSSWRRNWAREPTRPSRALEAALKKQPQDSDLHYNAACAYALASQAFSRKDPAKGRELADRAIRLLRTAIENGYADYKHMQEDTDLDPIREIPAFSEIMKARASRPLLHRRPGGRFSVRGVTTLRS